MSQDRDFEAACLPLLRILWPSIGHPPPLGWIDRAGIDLLAWTDAQPYRVAIQCKGFKVPDEDIGRAQLEQCLKSLDRFRTSGIRVETYLLIHNRTGRSAVLRDGLKAPFLSLLNTGQAAQAELWDRQRLLREVFNAAAKLTEEALHRRLSQVLSAVADDIPSDPIEEVPARVSRLALTPNRLLEESEAEERVCDPANNVLPMTGAGLTLLIGEAGYGKTTTLVRACRSRESTVYYVPAAAIPNDVNTTSSLLRTCVPLDDLFQEMPTDRTVFERLYNTVLPVLFKRGELPLVLFIDGLDESIYFSRRGGVQSLFNQLRDLAVPCVLAARTEYWTLKKPDFTAVFGFGHSESTAVRRYVSLVELLPWNETQILAYLDRCRHHVADDGARARLSALIDVITREGYDSLYGDIPRRPLFLRMIAESVQHVGLRHVGRARLVYEWALEKVRRDVVRPMRWGRFGRPPIVTEQEDVRGTVNLAFKAMLLAASEMTTSNAGTVELLPDIDLDTVQRRAPWLAGAADPTGLFLNSLLTPRDPRLPHESIRLTFAHRLFQEFFLALHLHYEGSVSPSTSLPSNVAELYSSIKEEGIVDLM